MYKVRYVYEADLLSFLRAAQRRTRNTDRFIGEACLCYPRVRDKMSEDIFGP